MQDNPSVHTTKNLQFFEQNDCYDLLGLSAQSPDLKPVENVWWAIEQALLIGYSSWNNNSNDKLIKYGSSMPSRIEAFIEAKEWRTKY